MSKRITANRSMNVRSTVSRILVAVVVAFGAGLSLGAMLWRSDTGTQRAQTERINVASAYKIADRMIVASASLAQERGLVFTILNSNKPPTSEQQATITQRREEAGAAFDEAVVELQSNFKSKGYQRLTTILLEGLQNVSKVRTTIDGLNSSQAPAGLASRWFMVSSRMIRTSEDVLRSLQLGIRSAGTDPETDIALRIQHLALVMSDLAGRERALISSSLAENASSYTRHSSALVGIRGQVTELWRQIKLAAATNELLPELKSHIDEINVAYFRDLDKTRRELQDATTVGEPATISASEWFGKSTAAINSMVEFGRKAGQFAQQRSARNAAS